MQSTINFGYLIFLSVVAALGGFLFGYDTAVISGTIAQVTQLFQLDALQQGWYVGCALVGSIIGVLFAGILSDKLGRKLTMVISAILFSASALGCALCTDFTQLVVYRIIGGVGIGVVSIVSPLYISEVSVAQYRGRLVSLYQLAVTVGFLGAYLVNYQLLAWSESGALLGVPLLNKIFITEVWRGMLGMETLPAILFFIIIFFIPESPRWLIVRGQERKAINILERIYNVCVSLLPEPWSSVCEISPRLERIETNSQFAQIISPTEMIALVTLHIKIGDVEGLMNICLPYLTLESVMDKLNTKFWYSNLQEHDDKQYTDAIEALISKAKIPVKAVLGNSTISVDDFVNLQVGDIIRLDSGVNQDLNIFVGNIKKFTALPGAVGDNYAVRVTSVVREEQ